MLSKVTCQFGITSVQVPSNAPGLLLTIFGETLECVATSALNVLNQWLRPEERINGGFPVL